MSTSRARSTRGLLERNAGEVKSGAGQYFTPRPLIEIITRLVDPEPNQTVHDPAVGTGGFLLAAYDHMKTKPAARDRKVAKALRETMLSGSDIVPEVVRLCAMNLYLHGIGGAISPVQQKDGPARSRRSCLRRHPDQPALRQAPVLSHRPRRWRYRQRAPGLRPRRLHRHHRQQAAQFPPAHHVDPQGRGTAAVVMPDNVLFEGGAGETLRRRLLTEFDFHTLLRLPTGISTARASRRMVLFFDRAPPGGGVATKDLWVYDLRTNQRFTLRGAPLKPADLADFAACFGTKYQRGARSETERFRRFAFDDLVKRDKLNLDLFWLKDAGATDPDSLPPPAEIAAEIVDSLELALEKFRLVAARLGGTVD